jgi:hypothetical protein
MCYTFPVKFMIGLGVATVIGIAVAPAASADADSYLAYLSSKGVNPIGTMTPGNLVIGGFRMCELIHSGMSPQDAAGSMGLFAGMLGAPVVEAAQHELCPDTLPR